MLGIPFTFHIQFTWSVCLLSLSSRLPLDPAGLAASTELAVSLDLSYPNAQDLCNRIVPRATWDRRICFTDLRPDVRLSESIYQSCNGKAMPSGKGDHPHNIFRDSGEFVRTTPDRGIPSARDRMVQRGSRDPLRVFSPMAPGRALTTRLEPSRTTTWDLWAKIPVGGFLGHSTVTYRKPSPLCACSYASESRF